MRFLIGPLLAAVLAIGLARTASAQSGLAEQPAPGTATLPSNASQVLTGKERLGGKWMDEQRIDNCKVPIDKRGTRPRSASCAHVPMG